MLIIHILMASLDETGRYNVMCGETKIGSHHTYTWIDRNKFYESPTCEACILLAAVDPDSCVTFQEDRERSCR